MGKPVTTAEFFDCLSWEQRDELHEWIEGITEGASVPTLRRKGLVGMWEPYSYSSAEWRALDSDNP
jgi:hypothetical protein